MEQHLHLRRLIYVQWILPILVIAYAIPGARAATPVHSNILYASINGYPLKLDLYLPTTATLGVRPFPVVVYIHGGGWTEGARAPLPRYAAVLPAYGFAVASIDYRLTSEGKMWGDAGARFPAQIHDVKGAVRWLRAHAREYHLDGRRIAAWGESAGGHLAALLGTSGDDPALEGRVGGNTEESSRIQGFVDYYGPIDLLKLDDDPTSPAMTYRHDAPGSYESHLIGFDGESEGIGVLKLHRNAIGEPFEPFIKLIEQVSPLTHITPDDPPCFIAHGTIDNLVPPMQSERLRDAYDQAGLQAEYRTARGHGHGTLGLRVDDAAMQFLMDVIGPVFPPGSPPQFGRRGGPGRSAGGRDGRGGRGGPPAFGRGSRGGRMDIPPLSSRSGAPARSGAR